MTAIVTRLSGGISQMFNPDTGKITYKCKAESGYLKLDAFGGIVKFNKNGSKATIFGPNTSSEDCDVIKEGEQGYPVALKAFLESQKKAMEEQATKLNQEISEISKKTS
jgi:hypothetical protein